jgi:hypothetical protein
MNYQKNSSLPEYLKYSEVFLDASQLWDYCALDYPFPEPGRRCGRIIHTKGIARIVLVDEHKVINLSFINGKTFQWNSYFNEFDNRFCDVEDLGAREIERRYIHSILLRIIDPRGTSLENKDIQNTFKALKIAIEVRLREIMKLIRFRSFEMVNIRRKEIAEIQAKIDILIYENSVVNFTKSP